MLQSPPRTGLEHTRRFFTSRENPIRTCSRLYYLLVQVRGSHFLSLVLLPLLSVALSRYSLVLVSPSPLPESKNSLPSFPLSFLPLWWCHFPLSPFSQSCQPCLFVSKGTAFSRLCPIEAEGLGFDLGQNVSLAAIHI